jgi:PAS domain S-box-containing protein
MGDPVAEDAVGDLQQALHELQVRQLEIEAECQELRASRARLEESVARLADRYDFAPIAYLTLDPVGRIVDANLTAAALFGRERRHLVGTFLSALVVPGRRRTFHAHVERCMRSQVRVDSEISFSVRGRPPVIAQVSSAPILDADGQPIGCKTVLTDISALKWSQQKLQFLTRASRLFASSFDVMTSFAEIARLAVPAIADVCIMDLAEDGGRGLRRIETAFADAATGERMEILGRATPHISEGMALARVIRTRETLLFDAPTVTPAGRAEPEHDPLVVAMTPASVLYVPIVGRERALGVLTFMATAAHHRYGRADVATMSDFGTHAGMAMESARLYEQAQRAITARQDVLSFVSHDLKNPLMGIMLTAQTMQRGAPAVERRRAAGQLERIQRAAEQMRRMINDLLDMTALEVGRLAIEAGPEDVTGLLAEAKELFAPLASAGGISLSIREPPNPLTVSCDRQRVVQVLTNLVDNALKFTPSGGRISISAMNVGGRAAFAVEDSGPGISRALQPRIFERFVQASKTAARGRGLGLYIAKGLVEAQGGVIWVDSEEGAGSTFSFTLPLASPAPVDTFGATMRAGAALGKDPIVRRG